MFLHNDVDVDHDIWSSCTLPGGRWQCIWNARKTPTLFILSNFNFKIKFVSMNLSETRFLSRKAPMIWN
jgi:hypothetical protein